MKFLIVSLTIILISITSPCLAFDYLDEVNIVDNIIKSFDEEPENWYFTNYEIIYAKNPKNLKLAMEELYPHHSSYSIIVIHFYFGRPDGFSYIDFKKPELYDSISRKDKQYKKFERAIKIHLYKRLKREVGGEVDVKIPEENKKENTTSKKGGYL